MHIKDIIVELTSILSKQVNITCPCSLSVNILKTKTESQKCGRGTVIDQDDWPNPQLTSPTSVSADS